MFLLGFTGIMLLRILSHVESKKDSGLIIISNNLSIHKFRLLNVDMSFLTWHESQDLLPTLCCAP